MSRILWCSNAPWSASGYGEQTNTFVPRIAALGHDMAIFCNYGIRHAILPWNGVPVYPHDNSYGNKALGTWVDVHQADAVIFLCDAFVLDPSEWPDGVHAAVWAPIDHYPIPPAVLAILSSPKITPIAMSRYGEKMMQSADLNPLYVPHGVDTSVFHPRPEIRDDVRDQLGIPKDAFVAGMVAANKSPIRKSFAQAFHAMSNFQKTHPDAWLYVHAEQTGEAGLDLKLLQHAVGLERVIYPEPRGWDLGMPKQMLAELYAMMDCLLMPSMGEGFGIPIVEAQACGVPVIASDHSAMTELTQAGWLVKGDPWWDHNMASFFMVPFIDSIHQALEAAYAKRGDQTLRDAAAAFGATYDADLITTEYWAPVLETIAPAESRQVRRARERKQAKVKA